MLRPSAPWLTKLLLYVTPAEVLNLEDNKLEGELPMEIYQLTNIQEIRLGGNSNLRGTINPVIGDLAFLTELSLGGSQFKGTLPSILFNLTGLLALELQGASFSGALSEEFSNFQDLEVLWLSNNMFTGSIPVEAFDGLTKLRKYYSPISI